MQALFYCNLPAIMYIKLILRAVIEMDNGLNGKKVTLINKNQVFTCLFTKIYIFAAVTKLNYNVRHRNKS